MKTVAFYTLGCKVNQYETEAIGELFEKSGYNTVDFTEKADVYVINTCSVTAMSDRKSRQIIRRAKKQNADSIIVVTGCYAQVSPESVLKIEGVNLVIGTNEKSKIVAEVEKLSEKSKSICVKDISRTHDFEEMTVTGYSSMTRAYIKIQEGCNQFCSYCIIPYARGPIRSRNPEEVIKEAKALANKGFTEIILVGIHIASYGLDIKTTSLADIILEVNKIDGIKRIRLSSIEPMTLNPEFIKKISPATKLCPHFHLSLQSGSEGTLKRMNRRYTPEEYKRIVNSIRENFYGAAITTDIMVGFPGETDEEFEESAKFAEEIGFADIHIFKYSPRPGTPAATYEDQVTPEAKEERSKILENIRREAAKKYLEGFVGTVAEVLFEQPSQTHKGWFEGKTTNYMTVLVKTDEDLSFKYRTVKLKEMGDEVIYGEVITG